MSREINRLIVESSIVFVSIFSTIGLLIGASTNEFKASYIYLGYMLYYSLPFILACSFGIVSILSEGENRLASEIISICGIAFFMTGLAMLVFLASSATQTSLLPTTFMFLMPYYSVPFLEFIVFAIILAITCVVSFVMSGFRRVWRFRNWLLAIFMVLFVVGIIIMTMCGVTQTTYIAKSETVSLIGSPDYPLKSINVTLDMADQVLVKIKSAENQYLSYVFLDRSNYELYSSSETRPSAIPIKSDFFGSDFSFTAVAQASSEYYLVMKSEYALGNNVSYSIQVFSTDNSLQIKAFMGSIVSLSVLLATSISKPRFRARALVLSRQR